jgi:hypothetical protein
VSRNPLHARAYTHASTGANTVPRAAERTRAPGDARAQAATEASTSKQANADMLTMIGGRNFISESELAKVKATRGGVEEESVEPLKPLVEVLREAKNAKQEAFDNQWKQMKQGGVCGWVGVGWVGGWITRPCRPAPPLACSPETREPAEPRAR